MRILMVNKYYPPHVGGIEFHMRDLAEGLVRAGHQVRALVCNTNRTYKEEIINGVEVIRLPRDFEKASTPVSFGFRKTLDRFAQEADIVHFHFPYPYAEFEWLHTKARKTVPYVVTYHADIVRQKLALALYRPFLNQFLNGAAVIMASSPQLIEYSPFLAPREEKCEQVNFGLHVERIAYNDAAKERARELKAQLNNHPIVLFVGRLIYYKGVDILVEAMADTADDVEFVVIGQGELRDAMIEGAREIGCLDRLHIIDYASYEDLIAWYHAADVFTLPSIYPSEAFGLVQIEAHAAHTPVVSTLLKSGVPYANLDGVTGISVEVGDAEALAVGINKLLNNDALREKLGRQAQERALTEFTIEAMIRNVEDVYREAVEERV